MRYAIILAGGLGTRMWPWSRTERPKQLLPLAGGRSLLKLAFERLAGTVDPANRLICAGESHRAAICSELGGLPDEQILCEPVGRDTAAALGLCAAILARRDARAVTGHSHSPAGGMNLMQLPSERDGDLSHRHVAGVIANELKMRRLPATVLHNAVRLTKRVDGLACATDAKGHFLVTQKAQMNAQEVGIVFRPAIEMPDAGDAGLTLDPRRRSFTLSAM